MHICLLLFNMPLSKVCGSSRFTIQIANELVTRGHQVTVIANKEISGKSSYKFDLIEVDTPPYGSWKNCLNDELSFFDTINKYLDALIKVHLKNNIDVLHAQHLLFSTLIAGLFNKAFKVPFISTCHGTETYESMEDPRMKSFFVFAQESKCITSASKTIIPDILKFINTSSKDIYITPPAVNTKDFSPNKTSGQKIRNLLKIQKSSFVILFAGRLVKEKGILEVPFIFQDFYNKHKDSVLLILGDGPEKSILENKLENLNLPKSSYRITGFIPQGDMAKYYNASDVFIMPSLWNEPFATSSLEAMACGCAVLVNNIGGISQMLNSKGFSQLICRRSHRKDFAIKLDKFYLDRDLLATTSKRLSELIKNEHTWKHRTSLLLSIYKKTLNI